MTRSPEKWEEPENEKYFSHTRNNGDNYFDPESWDIAPNTPQELIDSFKATMEQARVWKALGLDI